jgi:hypothetical protein
LSFDDPRRSPFGDRTLPLVEFRLRLECLPLQPSRAGRSHLGSSLGLQFPTAHAGSGDRPAAGFRPTAFRLQGLVTLLTAYSRTNPRRFYFAPAALMGLSLRSLLRPPSLRCVSTRMSLHTVSASTWIRRRRRRTVTEARGFQALASTRVPCGRREIKHVSRRMLPWVFALLGYASERLGKDFALPPPAHLPDGDAHSPGRWRLEVSISARLALPTPVADGHGSGQPL